MEEAPPTRTFGGLRGGGACCNPRESHVFCAGFEVVDVNEAEEHREYDPVVVHLSPGRLDTVPSSPAGCAGPGFLGAHFVHSGSLGSVARGVPSASSVGGLVTWTSGLGREGAGPAKPACL